jgi:hypothetical protein
VIADADLPLFAWSPPADPSPTPEKFRRAKGDPRDYRAEWLAFVEAQPDAALTIRDRAYGLMMDGHERISVALIFEHVRCDLHVSINTSHAAACSDWLIAQDPRLAGLIERRQRKVTK